jgi:hypothetical protein
MSIPTWQNVLTNVLTSGLNRSAMKVGVTFPDFQYKVNRLEAAVEDLKSVHQDNLRIILISIDLKLAFLTGQPIAKLLRACGIEDLADLPRHDCKALHEKMERENKKPKQPVVDIVPDVQQLESWAQAAKLASEWAPSGGQSGAADS